MHRFVHVGFNFAVALKITELEPVFTAIGDDWIRYTPLCWILWTDKPTPHIYTLLSPHLTMQDNVLIVSIAPGDLFGLLPPWAWDWLHSKNPSRPIYRGEEAANITKLPAETLKALKFRSD